MGQGDCHGKGKYSRLSWDEKQARLAFVKDRKLYGWNRGGGQALELAEGNQSKAAKKLNLGIDAFRYRMKKFGLLEGVRD